MNKDISLEFTWEIIKLDYENLLSIKEIPDSWVWNIIKLDRWKSWKEKYKPVNPNFMSSPSSKTLPFENFLIKTRGSFIEYELSCKQGDAYE